MKYQIENCKNLDSLEKKVIAVLHMMLVSGNVDAELRGWNWCCLESKNEIIKKSYYDSEKKFTTEIEFYKRETLTRKLRLV